MASKAEALRSIQQQRRRGTVTYVCEFGDNVRTTFPKAFAHIRDVHGWGSLTVPSWWFAGNGSDHGSR